MSESKQIREGKEHSLSTFSLALRQVRSYICTFYKLGNQTHEFVQGHTEQESEPKPANSKAYLLILYEAIKVVKKVKGWRNVKKNKDGGEDIVSGEEVNKNLFVGTSPVAQCNNLPANAGDMGSSPGPGRSHMPRSN